MITSLEVNKFHLEWKKGDLTKVRMKTNSLAKRKKKRDSGNSQRKQDDT